MRGNALPVSFPTEGSLGGKRKATWSWRKEGKAGATSVAMMSPVPQFLGVLMGELGSRSGVLAWLLAPVSSYWMNSLPFNLPNKCFCYYCSYALASVCYATKCQTHQGKVVLLIFLHCQITRYQFTSYNTVLQTRPDRFPHRPHAGMW